eukprot:scaffold83903_cov19-Prasinocladus_malaysianus.AAC.1
MSKVQAARPVNYLAAKPTDAAQQMHAAFKQRLDEVFIAHGNTSRRNKDIHALPYTSRKQLIPERILCANSSYTRQKWTRPAIPSRLLSPTGLPGGPPHPVQFPNQRPLLQCPAIIPDGP